MQKRGLREGCASSCTLYNVFHNCALEELIEQCDAWNTFEMLALIALQRENERRPKRCTASRENIAMSAHFGFC